MILSSHFLSLSTSLYLSILVHALSIHTHSSPTIYLHLSISAHSIIITFSIHSLYLPLYTIYTFSVHSLYLSLCTLYLLTNTLSLSHHSYTLSTSLYLHSISLYSLYLHSISLYSLYISLYTLSTLFTHTLYLHTLLLYLSTSLHTLTISIYTLSILYLYSISLSTLYLHSIYLPSSPTYIILILLLYDLYITLCVLRRYSLFCRELEGVMIIVDRLRNS